MIELIKEIKISNTNIPKTKIIILSIQLSLDGFSFCISDANSKESLFFKEYQFHEIVNTPEELLQQVQYIFKSDTNLQLEFTRVEVIHENNLATLVPRQYFDENLLASYLNLNVKTFKNDFIAFDELINTPVNNVYIPFVNINNYLFQNFGEFVYKHHLTVLIDKLIVLNRTKEKTMYVYVAKKSIDIIVLEDKKLQFSNTFTYHTQEDFIYYLLFVAEQLQMDTTKFQLYFLGFIDKTDKNYKIAYKYIQHILFLESTNPLFKELDAANHNNYILLGS